MIEVSVTQEERNAAASAFLEEEDAEPATWDDCMYGIGGDWLILSDEEADVRVRENIEQDIWAFVPSFLVNYLPDGVDEEVIRILQEAKSEGAAPAIRGMVGDRFDEFADDAISADGRGHFLSSWDGVEHEFTHEGRTWYAYRN